MADFGKLNFNISLKPTTAFPLDARCYFESLAEAEAAAQTAEEAGSTNTIYYFGQKLVVVTDDTATWYTIQPDKTLKADVSGSSSGGDMLKSTYDTNNDGKVDHADTAANALMFGGQLPSYYAKASELGGYIPTSVKGQANGVASLDADSKLPESQLPDHKHGQGDINGLEKAISDMTEIANGKCDCYVFDTETALDTALAEYVAFVTNGTAMSDTNLLKEATLKTGDVFLIREVKVPDYWWDESTKSKQPLETTKVDLSVITNAEIDEILAT